MALALALCQLPVGALLAGHAVGAAVVLDTFPVIFAVTFQSGLDPAPETICCKDLRVRSRPPLCQSFGWL